MTKRKILALVLSLALVLGVAIPGAATVSAKTADFDVDAAYEKVMNMGSDSEVEEYLSSLPQEDAEALSEYANGVAQAEAAKNPPKTVTFTDAGPFLPAVNIAATKQVRKAAKKANSAATLADEGSATTPERTDSDGVVTSKTVTVDKDGNYKLRLESYVTGATTTSTTEKTTPVDIVLVLDQSSSMNDTFSTSGWNKITNQDAMKSAVTGFINSVADTYSADADHRIALVTFGKSATTVRGLTFVDQSGKNTLNGNVNNLRANSSDTAPGTGMERAYNILHTNYSYDGKNTERQKVVILFTDGVPAPSGTDDFTIDLANDAIAQAKKLKDAGDTVYSIGIFKGANPNQLYGSGSNGSVNSTWSSNDRTTADTPAGNRFLNYVSSNAPGATSVGLAREKQEGSWWSSTTYKFTITQNFNMEKSGYYLTASNAEDLEKIFQSISENIQTGGASVTLDSSTVVKDVISDYFQLHDGADASKITVKTADCNSFDGETPIWTNEQTVDLTPTINGKTVSVTGFHFSENWVGKDKTTGEVHPGKKLIIEIPIEPREGFIGGNNVPTNGSDSGIYTGDTAVENFEVPEANVPINPVVATNDKTIYQGNSTKVDGLYTLPNHNDEESWKYDFVNVAKESVKEGNEIVSADTVSPGECTDYTVTWKYTPKTAGNGAAGNANAMTGVISNAEKATVHVLKPTVTATVNDVEKYYDEDYTLGAGASGSIDSVTWEDENNHTKIPSAEGKAPYNKDDLRLEYSSDQFGDKQSGIVPKDDFDVNVKVVNGNNEIENAVITTTCEVSGENCGENEKDNKYTVHVKTCTLTITKLGGEAGEPYVFNVYRKGGTEPYTQARITGNGSVTINELPVGTYSIAEDIGWSWRYTSRISDSVELKAENNSDTGTITCTNEKNKDKTKWLNGYSSVKVNTFGVPQLPDNK